QYVPLFLKKGCKVVDLSADYRLPGDVYEKWFGVKHADADNISKAVYGLPEINREKIRKASLVANPGCYPTSVILGLLPLADFLAKHSIAPIVDSKSGTSGAGRKGTIPLSFSEVGENLKCYKPNDHQHIPEMEHVLGAVAGKSIKVNFAPHLLPVRRGILSTIYVDSKGLTEKEVVSLYLKRYEKEPFVRVRPEGSELPQILDVAGTNFCDIGIRVARGLIIIVSVIDNLMKGASGQAVENMNLMLGMDERVGLLK
ncbi:MAG: N-acetyl-gamma-glutamyl-phosphate reductase, partial [Candidatus Omnitrophica bacterium]|nr:N-acetyl-gamma-glutamyl-phosphate reductase [Candidatus Omnitrophota bacterium]